MIVRPSRRSAGVSLSHYNDLFKQSSCPLACRNRLCGVDGGPVEATLRCRRSGGILASAARGRNRRHRGGLIAVRLRRGDNAKAVVRHIRIDPDRWHLWGGYLRPSDKFLLGKIANLLAVRSEEHTTAHTATN